MPKISVIIPVYNVEKFLHQCLDSVINQTYKDFECIIINDGSPDNSLKIMKEYAKKDKRIKIIDQKNQGVSVARNSGINQAIGEWIYIFDSDDFLELNALETLIKTAEAENTDLINFDWYKYENGKATYQHNPDSHKNKNDWVALTSWNLFFKRKYLVQNPEIRFAINIHPTEDTLFNFMLLSIVENKYLLKEALINYRHHDNMITNKKKNKEEKEKFKDNVRKAIFKLTEYIKNNHNLKEERYKAGKILVKGQSFWSKQQTGLYAISTREYIKLFPEDRFTIYLNSKFVKFFYQKKQTRSGKTLIKILKIPVISIITKEYKV